MINFKAQYIQPAVIKQKGVNNQYQDYKVSIAELKIDSQEDFIALNNLNCDWDNCKSLTNDIAKIFNALYAKTKPSEGEHFYVATVQKDNYNKLDKDNILGIIHTRKTNNGIEIENLQVSPETNYSAVVRQFKEVGQSLINLVIKLNKNTPITLIAEYSVTPFYEKLGFIKVCKDTTQMVLKR